MKKRFNIGIIGATGMVGQRFIALLNDHPWFHIAVLAASGRSAGKTYGECVEGRWAMETPIPKAIAEMTVMDASAISQIAPMVDFVFCAISASKAETRALEERYAKAEIPVISNNSACRMVADVPMLIPEINPEHATIIHKQRERLGTKKGFIAVKPNCSIQSYVPILTPLLPYGIEEIAVCTYQAISGAGKTFNTMPEILDNIIPFIGGEEEKSEQEPLKVWGKLNDAKDAVIPLTTPTISAQCLRVPVSDGHTAAVSVRFTNKPTKEEIVALLKNWETLPQILALPSAPTPFITVFEEDNRPQAKLDRDIEKGMGVCVGRLREDTIFDYKFVGLSHNTLRGAAGGGVLMAELLCAQGYMD